MLKKMSVPCEMLLHPELLTNEQIIYRHLRIPNLENMPREDLLDIFHQFCVPYGQRKYRDSGRGKVLNKTRPVSPQPNLNLLPKNTRKFTHSDNYQRLKPPPDLLSGHIKRIKLDNVDTDTNLKRRMSIDSITPAADSPPNKKVRKPITWP